MELLRLELELGESELGLGRLDRLVRLLSREVERFRSLLEELGLEFSLLVWV